MLHCENAENHRGVYIALDIIHANINTELNDLKNYLFEKILMSLKIHCLSCFYTNNVIDHHSNFEVTLKSNGRHRDDIPPIGLVKHLIIP